MKKYDKGYIYSALLSDLFSSFLIMFVFLEDIIFSDDGGLKNIIYEKI